MIKKLHLLASTVFLAGAMLGAVLTSQPVRALSNAEQQVCKDKWEGSWEAGSTKDKNYLKSNCQKSEGGVCTRTTARVPNDTGSGETVRATVACDLGTVNGTGGGSLPDTAQGCSNVKTTLVDCEDGTGGPIVRMLVQLINFLAVGVGIAVAGGITWGGFVYSQANGNSSKTQEGVHIITNSVIGLLLFIFMYAIINWLVPGGLL
jgi:hypothetical protein